MESALKKYLRKHNIKYIEHKHSPVFTVEESKDIKKSIPGVNAKSLFLKGSNERFYLICLPGEKFLDLSALRKSLKLKKLYFASLEELKSELNITPGSVSIFSLIHAKSTILFLDKELWDAEIVGFHPNINTITLELPHKSLEKFYNSLKTEKHVLSLKTK